MTEPQPPKPGDEPLIGQPPAPTPQPPAHGPVGADGWELPPVPQAGAWDQGQDLAPWTQVPPEAWEKLPPSMRAHLTAAMEAQAAAQAAAQSGPPAQAVWPGSQAAPSAQPTQPGWPGSQAAQPPQPGWPAQAAGTPQAGWPASPAAPQPPQPGWPAAPPQVAWAAPSGQPGWPTQTTTRRSRRPFAIGCLVLLVLLVVGVGGCIAMLAGSVAPAASVVAASNGQIDTFSAQNTDGHLSIIFTAAPRVNASAGPTLACSVIVPTLKSSGAGNAEWVLLDSSGEMLASSHVTFCP